HIRCHSGAKGRWLEIGAAVTIRDFFESPLVQNELPGIERYETSFASTLIRNLATVGGNIVNASPVGDITSMLMALGARLVIIPAAAAASYGAASSGTEDAPIPAAARILPLEQFFLGYKKIDLQPSEILAAIRVPLPAGDRKFSFEKISKRRNLDIAAVNTAIFFTLDEGRFHHVRISLGGVAPIPVLCHEAMAVLEGANCQSENPFALAALARRSAEAAASSVNPIDDVRGSAEYRRRMVRMLMLAHFIRLFESSGIAEELFP
ncbi:MAG: FAD binding domain-containing protein, partial [Rectinema sp.]|nr:FAD binding domain-containing protein [Rectinema sp.]